MRLTDKTAEEMIDELLEKYKDDEEAVELILRAEKELHYIRNRHEGQTAEQYILGLAGHLEFWF